MASLTFVAESPGEVAERLEAMRGETLEWSEPGSARVRARMVGYTGGAGAPEAVVLEVVAPGGDTTRVSVPYAALGPLWEYLAPWLHLPGDDVAH